MQKLLTTWSAPILVAASLAAFFVFGMQHLTQFETADEAYWIQERIPQYWHALETHNWKKTFINDKPGVSVALVSGVGLLFHDDTTYYQSLRKDTDNHPTQIAPAAAEELFFTFRFPLLVFNALLLVYFYWVIKKIFASKVAAAGTVVGIALSPILIGISQIVNPDALLWSCGFAAFLSYVLFVRTRTWHSVFLTAGFLALALLSKYTALVLLPVFVVAAVLYVLYDPDMRSKRFAVRAYTIAAIAQGSLGIIALTAIGMAALLPAVIVDHSKISEMLLAFSGGAVYVIVVPLVIFILLSFTRVSWMRQVERMRPLWTHGARAVLLMPLLIMGFLVIARTIHDPAIFSVAPIDIKYVSNIPGWKDLSEPVKILNSTLLQYNQLAFSVPIVVMVLMFFFWARHGFGGTVKNGQFFAIGVSATVLFVLIPFGFVFEHIETIARYLIMLYPLAALLAAMAFEDVMGMLSTRSARPLVCKALFAGGMILTLFLVTMHSAPFYFNYTNALLSKDKIIHDAWGYGGYEAAQFINADAAGRDIVVWADYDGVCPFIKGTCFINYHVDQERFPIDYYVLTRRGRIRFNPEHRAKTDDPNLVPAYNYYDVPPTWAFAVGNRPENYVRVVRP